MCQCYYVCAARLWFRAQIPQVLDEGSAQVSGRLEPVDGARQDHAAGALPIRLWLIHAGWISPSPAAPRLP